MTQKKWIALGVVVLVLGIAGYGYKSAHSPEKIAPAAGGPGGAPQGPMPVTVETVTEQEVQTWHEFSGRLVAVDRVNVLARAGGAIDKVYFEPGAIVEKGQKLFLLDPRPYQAAVNQAAATVATARAQANLANTESERAERLIKDNAISQREYASRTNSLQVTRANIQAAEAALEQAKLNLDYATITAPVRGKISRAEVTVGNLVNPAAGQVLAEIVSLDPIYADFTVDEQTYLQHVRQENASDDDSALPVELSLQGDQGVIYKGKIVSFDNQLDTTSGTIRARAVFKNKDHVLVPGMYATVHLGSADRVNAILVSDRYINTDQDKKFVYAVGNDNTVQYRPVTLGAVVEGKRIIQSGLQPGDRIIIKGLQRLRPGMPVVPSEEGTAPPAEANKDATKEDQQPQK